MSQDRHEARKTRASRIRYRLRQATEKRLRLTVFRSAKHIYAQIIDDAQGQTLVSASTLDKDVRETIKYGGNKEAAAEVGKRLAEKAKAVNLGKVVFDRSGYLYHGRVKELADAAREGGLDF
ncbi:MAG: 50S ribosomal protein L18 [Magnetococcales bacterium]|nr:50S ribosomal protein L18 [Magnetococcales bacterium]